MSELLTARQLQELLNVDRTTIYRMANSGKIPAVRVGNQWRFPREAIEMWLAAQTPQGRSPTPSGWPVSTALADLLPHSCIQPVMDTFAELLGVMLLLTDMEGRLLTRPSHPCGLYQALSAFPQVHERCMEQWLYMARDPSLHPQFVVSELGFLCARGVVRVESELKAMVIAGGVAPEHWPPSPDEMARLAQHLGVPLTVLEQHVEEVYVLSPVEKARVLTFVQRIADVISHIIAERQAVMTRLERIRQLATWPQPAGEQS